MGAKRNPILVGLAGLLFPGLGQLLNGRKKAGLLFFMLGNVIFLTAFALLFIKVYRAAKAIPLDATSRGWLIMEHIGQSGLGILLILGIIYFALLFIAAANAFWTARKDRLAN